MFQACSSPSAKTEATKPESEATPTAEEVNAKQLKREAREKYENEDFQGAIATWTEFLKSNPNDEAGHYNRGRAYAKLKNHPAAVQDFTQALKVDPNSAKTYARRGESLAELGKQKSALVDYQKAVELYQKQGKAKDAEEILEKIKALQANPSGTPESESES
jgi:tetratricopeptide (TPR) repeat protein